MTDRSLPNLRASDVRLCRATEPKACYAALFESAFPRCERRSEAQLVRALADPRFRFLEILRTDNGTDTFAGFAALWRLESGDYLEHLALTQAMRGQGLGTAALEAILELCAKSEDKRPFLIEIDPRTTDVARRRAAFYERLGFRVQTETHRHPPYRKDLEGHELELLARGELPREVRETFLTELAEVVMRLERD